MTIEDHAFLSDCSSAALITVDGSVDWLCLPRIDSPAIFGRLLDQDAGHFLVRPVDDGARAQRRYLPQSLVLETVWTCASGRVVVRDALALGENERGHDLGLTSPGVLLRQAICTDGDVDMLVEWVPRPEYGLVHPRLENISGGVLGLGGSTSLLLSANVPIRIDGALARAEVRLRTGQEITLAFTQGSAWESPPPPWSSQQVAHRIDDTARAWRSWSDLHQRYDGPLRDLVHHSGVVLQGLTYARSGAIAAAATTSLPEGVGTPRTWDYRFAWVRDASMTMRGLWVAACPDEASRFFTFLSRAAGTQLQRGLHLQIMYGVGGERDLTERELNHLDGWRDSGPVRVGNGAWRQHQHDVYGAILDAAYVLRDELQPMDESTQEFLIAAVEAAATHWRNEDQGIWEIRGPSRRYLHSALLCWVALDRGIELADLIGAADRVSRWSAEREEIRETILTEGWNDAVGAFTQTLAGDDLDASCLLMAVVGILPGDDPRLHATIDAIVANLSDGQGLLYRYRTSDGLTGDEGTFLLCTFWLVEALAATGRTDEAKQVLHRAASFANDLGLLAEQVDRNDGLLLGNFPQAFSHLGLILASQAVAMADSRTHTTG
uniref:glycoside hydrolase family 15 protein n=1 Tax=Paractinoplanes polyasparticus TaxID=2856853 RepID=UPI0027DECA35|nr:glycoside hydrolase family 15 protein [Actinoplanes polyasparticus]